METNVKQIFVLSKDTVCGSNTIAASEDRQKLHVCMKNEITAYLTDRFGDRDSKTNLEDEYVQEMFQSVDDISPEQNSWTDEDDEFPVTFAIETVEII